MGLVSAEGRGTGHSRWMMGRAGPRLEKSVVRCGARGSGSKRYTLSLGGSGQSLLRLQPPEHLLSAGLLVVTAEVFLAPAYVHGMTG